MKRFRWVVKTDKVMLELTYCLQQLQAPLLSLFQAISEKVFAISNDPSGSGHPDAYRLLMPMMSALRTICRIFFSLNWLVLIKDIHEQHTSFLPCYVPLIELKCFSGLARVLRGSYE